MDDTSACLRVLDGKATVTPGPNAEPSDVTVRCAAPTIAAIVGRALTIEAALSDGKFDVSGDPAAVAALLELIERMLAR
ncbi:hypothetical protein [[Mycobacterium] wendilense]|uniref:hypothetical protein n=1 Tax=[Mycobacterium] wendilense TaxID=3064284 RepID=UPI0037C6F82F